MRKQYRLLIPILGILLIGGCQKIKDITTFKIRHETEVTIPGQNTGIGELLSLPRAEIQTSSEQKFENNNTRANLVEEVVLNELVLTITAPENENFDFLNEINIYMKADGEEGALIASKSNIPEDGSRSLELETTGINLRPYIIKETYTIRTEAKTDQVLDHDVDMKINLTFLVKAKVF